MRLSHSHHLHRGSQDNILQLQPVRRARWHARRPQESRGLLLLLLLRGREERSWMGESPLRLRLRLGLGRGEGHLIAARHGREGRWREAVGAHLHLSLSLRVRLGVRTADIRIIVQSSFVPRLVQRVSSRRGRRSLELTPPFRRGTTSAAAEGFPDEGAGCEEEDEGD